LLGFQPGPPKTSRLYKFLYREQTFWLWLDGADALFSDNWSAPLVDTASGYHLYVIDTLTNETKTLVYTGLRSFHVRILTWVDYHEKLIKYDRMNGQLVMVTRIRNCHGNSKYRVYIVTLDLEKLTFSTMLRITVPYGEFYDGIFDLSFSFDADKFCAKDTTPGLDARLMFYSLQVPTCVPLPTRLWHANGKIIIGFGYLVVWVPGWKTCLDFSLTLSIIISII
jgi:hypothetical protein